MARDFSALRAALNSAVDAELIPWSPARKIALPRAVPSEESGLTPSELSNLAKEMPDHYRALVLLAAVSGLRWGEAIGLRVRDVDFMRRTVTVAQVVEELAGHMRVVPEAKTRSSLRTLSAPSFLMDELASHLADHRSGIVGANIDPDSLIFLGPRGELLRRRFGERILKPAAARAWLPPSLTFHGSEHYAAGQRHKWLWRKQPSHG